MLFGHLKANAVSGVYATALLTLAAATDKMSAAMVTLAKRIARTAHPMIRPIRVNRDEEWFVMFVPSMAYRDLLLDPVIINALQYAWNRGSDNPLFTAGDILYDGVIIREITGTSGPTRARWCRDGIDVAASATCAARRHSALPGHNARSCRHQLRATMASCTASASRRSRGCQS